MYIIQMADLHIGSDDATNPKEADFMKNCAEIIRKDIAAGSKLLFCICGDIIDSKGLKTSAEDQKIASERYQQAEELIETFKDNLGDGYQIEFRCCAGNHDSTHMEGFKSFSDAINVSGRKVPKSKLESCYTYEVPEENLSVVFVNSSKNQEHKMGKIDYELLAKELEKIPAGRTKIIVLHHTIMSMYEDDSSSIRNAAEMVQLVGKYNVSGILHGHIHGRDILNLGNNQCKVIGTGALFTRNNPNVNSQFNVIKFQSGAICSVRNYRYNEDEPGNNWSAKELLDVKEKYIFEGSDFQAVYEQLMRQLETRTPLEQVTMRIVGTYEDFVSNLESFLLNDYIKIGDNKYDYPTLAKMWEKEEVPEELYFNHGNCFNIDGKSGIDFICDQIKAKPTSNKIILTTSNMKRVRKAFEKDDYLPSLLSIQFGLEKNTGEMKITMTLRALEAGYFLKINICEIKYILEELIKRSIDIRRVNIAIYAFRVQKREKFLCFLKAQIDVMGKLKLAAVVNHAGIDRICQLLQEKRDGVETITRMEGLRTLYDSMNESNLAAADIPGAFIYPQAVLDILKEVLELYEKLDNEHKKTSIRKDTEKDIEAKIDAELGRLIAELEKLKS